MSVKTANGPIAYNKGLETPDFFIPMVTAPLTLTNELEAAGFIAADTSYMWKVDMSGVRQVRLTGRVKTVSTSANTPTIRVRYYTEYSTTVGDYLALGESEVSFSLFTGATLGDSGWIALAAGARIDSCFLALQTIGGDGDKDPIVNQVMLHCR